MCWRCWGIALALWVGLGIWLVAETGSAEADDPPPEVAPQALSVPPRATQALPRLDPATQQVLDGLIQDAASAPEQPPAPAATPPGDAASKRVSSSEYRANLRACAVLAAGLARAGEMLDERRFADAETLLGGILRAVGLFSDPKTVAIYRRGAERLLERARAQREGAVASAHASAQGENADAPLAKEAGGGDISDSSLPLARAPMNFSRLLEMETSGLPAWYASQRSRLATIISVDYRQVAMSQVIEDLRAKTGARFIRDEPVAQSRVLDTFRLDLRASALPAEAVLDMVCRKCDIEYVWMERGIVLTTPVRARAYAQRLPEILANNWLAARWLFPSLAPDRVAGPPAVASRKGTAAPAEAGRSSLTNGDQLYAEVRRLLAVRPKPGPLSDP